MLIERSLLGEQRETISLLTCFTLEMKTFPLCEYAHSLQTRVSWQRRIPSIIAGETKAQLLQMGYNVAQTWLERNKASLCRNVTSNINIVERRC